MRIKTSKELEKLSCSTSTKYLLSTTSSLLSLFPAKFIANRPKASPEGIRREIAVIDGAVDGDLN